MDQGTLVNSWVDAGERFVREFAKYKPVKAAFWLRSEGDEDWYLYIASPEIDDDNFDQAYREVLRIANEGRTPWLDPFRVKVVGSNNRRARAIAEFADHYLAKPPIVMHGARLGDVWVESAIVYTPPFDNRRLAAHQKTD